MKTSFRLLSDAGYRSLSTLAAESPQLFMNGASENPDTLETEMQKIESEPNWAGVKSLNRPINELNEICESGPGADYHHSKILREALGDLAPQEYSDELLWASLNCFPLAKYTAVRWRYTPRRSSKTARNVSEMTNFVQSHWLRCPSDGRRANASARLFWLGELSRRFAPESSRLDEDEMLQFLSGNVNVYHQILSRPYLSGVPTLMAKIIDAICDPGNEYLKQTKNISDLMMAINVRAGAQSLDIMDDDELSQLVRESLPPKER